MNMLKIRPFRCRYPFSLMSAFLGIVSTTFVCMSIEYASAYEVREYPRPQQAYGPMRPGGNINEVAAQIHAEFHYGSCARGLFSSAAVQVLGVRGIYLDPGSEYWFHNASHGGSEISPPLTRYYIRGLPRGLQGEVLALLGNGGRYHHVVYRGAELIQRFGYRPC